MAVKRFPLRLAQGFGLPHIIGGIALNWWLLSLVTICLHAKKVA